MRLLCVLFGLAMLASGPASAQPAEPLHAGDMAQIRASFKGRALLLHVWSLTCAPCLVEMPTWAERIRKNPGVAFVFINTDGVRHAAAAARRLAASGVQPARSLVYADDFVERLQYEIAPEWQGELPRTEGVYGTAPPWVTLGPVPDRQFRQWLASAR
jgi:thiol-disulfide isomerase/thioredoxin